MKILVTGFEPFGADQENASEIAVRLLASRWDGSADLVVAILPVTFAGAPEVLRELVQRHGPDAVLAVGEAGGRAAVTPERFGRNRIDARIPDNDGAQPRDRVIDDGPVLRPATLDVEEVARQIRATGVAAEVSEDAGAFVCNRVAVELTSLDVPAAFVHVPAVRSWGTAGVGAETDPRGADVVPQLTVDDLALALAACVEAAVTTVRSADADQTRHR